ncbi:hypothetical protein [Megalodesulfovibrio paquesii]
MSRNSVSAVHQPLVALALGAALVLTAAALWFLWTTSTPGPTVVRQDGAPPDTAARARPVPPAPEQLRRPAVPDPDLPPPDDLLTDLAGAVLAGYVPAVPGAVGRVTLDLPALAGRYALADVGGVSPAMLSLAYFMAAEPLVQRMAWCARQQGDGAAALTATAATVRELAACHAPPSSPNCAFALEFLAGLAGSNPPEQAAVLTARARVLLQDLAARLDRAAQDR